MSFKDQIKADLDVFFNADEFAEEVEYYEGAISSSVIVQFFDEESGLGDSLIRKLIVKCEDLPNLSKSGYFDIKTIKYGVIDFVPDEQGLIFNVVLRKGME